MIAARDLLEPPRLAQHGGDLPVVVDRLVVEHAEVLRARHLAELDAHHVAGVPPILLHGDGVGERVHGVEDHQVGLAEELDEDELEEDSVALSLINANEMGPDEIKDELHDVVKRLFKDAGVAFDRLSKRGESYSIADETYNEYCSWFDYPWD